MSKLPSVATDGDLSPERGEAGRRYFWQNLIAACVSIAWNASFLFMSLALPEGHSRGDVGPGSLPMQVAMFGLIVSLVYLIQVLRQVDLGGTDGRIDIPRVAGLIGLFIAVALGANWIGLALCLGIGSGLGTLLFPGRKPLTRAVTTGVGFYLIAHFLFGVLLELPLP